MAQGDKVALGKELNFTTCDVGEKIDKYAMVVFKEIGDYKAPVPQNAEIVVMNAKTFEPHKPIGRFIK